MKPFYNFLKNGTEASISNSKTDYICSKLIKALANGEFRTLAFDLFHVGKNIRDEIDLVHDLKFILDFKENCFIWIVAETGTYLLKPCLSVSLLETLLNIKKMYIIESLIFLLMNEIIGGSH